MEVNIFIFLIFFFNEINYIICNYLVDKIILFNTFNRFNIRKKEMIFI